MPRFQLVVAALLVALVVTPTGWSATYYEHHTYRRFASPGPAAGTALLSDTTTYRLLIPSGVAVEVVVSSATTAFHLRFYEAGAQPPLIATPAFEQRLLLRGPGAIHVEVDPVAGVAPVDILATFRGYVVDIGGGAAHFELRDISELRACATPEVCLS